jgi:ankyrin repeat protein
MTPLYYAVMTRNEEVLELLLNNGQGNVDYKLNSSTGSMYTYTALMRAVEMRSEKMVQMLLAKGANPTTTSYAAVIGGDGEDVAETTPLEWARAKGDRPEIVTLLESVKFAA